MKKIKIGIFGNSDLNKFFSNGLYQNAWSLAYMLKGTGEFEVTFFTQHRNHPKDILGIKCEMLNLASIGKLDIFISVAATPAAKDCLYMKGKGVKFISIKYGNNLLSDLEAYVQQCSGLKSKVVTTEWIKASYDFGPDLILRSPHFSFQDQYLSLTNQISEDKILECPYIWNPIFLKAFSKSKQNKFGDEYSLVFKRGDWRNKSAVCAEPSLATLKTNLVPMVMLDKVHRDGDGDLISGYLLGSAGLIDEESSKDYVQKMMALKSFKDGVLKLDRRVAMTDVMAKRGRLLVSHQKQNELNYTYFEFALSGFPFVHNSKTLSEYGYYYEEDNVLDGVEKIKEALNHENLTAKELSIYNNRCEDMIWKYSPHNPRNISKYVDLIKSVL